MNRDAFLQAWAELFHDSAMLIVTIGSVGVLVILGLAWSWRRFMRREQQLGKRQPTIECDPWTASGQRLRETPPDDEDEDER